MRVCEAGRSLKSELGGAGLLHINVQRFRGWLVFKAHRICVSLDSRRESNKEDEGEGSTCRVQSVGSRVQGVGCRV